ncbi:DUF2806 domain-containing protein [Astrobacterium formosum]|uniref:DUF2806 domain-containing protein n=1 Tax=Astrobacterium formosum TaxID=3069710 RepID=UPI003F502B34
MPEDQKLPTISEMISDWLGVQLPSVPLPQTIKNADKAIGKLMLAFGENIEVRVRNNTLKQRALGKIALDELVQSQEDKRKLANRASVVQIAFDDLASEHASTDAPSEIEDDWLNVFARISEDKSSEELQVLFGRILAGEIRRPGSFSLRTIQIMATISKQDAERLSTLLSFTINEILVPYKSDENGRPEYQERMFLEEIGIGGPPSEMAQTQLEFTIEPSRKQLIKATQRGILVENGSASDIKVAIRGQHLTSSARELLTIANPPQTSFQYLKEIAADIQQQLNGSYSEQVKAGGIAVRVVDLTPVADNRFHYSVVFTCGSDEKTGAVVGSVGIEPTTPPV